MPENKKSKIRMYSRKGVKVAIPNFKEEVSISSMFEIFITDKSIEGISNRTLHDYHVHFEYLMKFLGENITNIKMTKEMFKNYLSFMLHEQCLSPVTVNVRIRTIRAFLRYCFLHGYIEEPIHEYFKPVRTKEDTLESFTPQEIKRLLSVVEENSYKGFRDKVIIYVLLDTLVRCAELINIKRTNIDLKAGFITLESLNTKTKKGRTVPISTKTIKLLKEYIQITEEYKTDFLFLTYEGEPLSDNTVRKNLTEIGEKAGVNKRVSPHTFRHTGALFYVLNGGDPFSLQKILGHSDMSMVRKYIQMTNTDVKKQHNIFSPLNTVFK
ncbi:tyrosine-type recombinase/integrase [Cytobacillus oceanisediminis]|uniref:tyrosine-type recombinase/integrase n=1 Tax=Cytobacillus oceanisediminis TaxID=665099 RepID=UPI001C22F0E6|nr:tyrosine-type recombinase/integrase [Cytobacillus oceanisediminis]MBU8768764.1 tyrosine-type recombinase/integrase [Cytobacillus oceanisediminis]